MLHPQEKLNGHDNTLTAEVPTSIENNGPQFSLTFGRSANTKDKQWIQHSLTLGELNHFFAKHSFRENKDGYCFIPATLLDGRRNLNSVSEVFMLVFDIDGEQSIEEVDALVAKSGRATFCYTTHSHHKNRTTIVVDHYEKWAKGHNHPPTPTLPLMHDYLGSIGKGSLRSLQFQSEWLERVPNIGNVYYVLHEPVDKMRVVFPLKSPMNLIDLSANNTRAIAEYKAIYHGIGRAIGLAYDKSCCDPSRLFYLPSCPKTMKEHAWAKAYNGELLDWTSVERVHVEPAAPKKKPVEQQARKPNESPLRDVNGVVVNVSSWATKNQTFDIEGLLEGKLRGERGEARGNGGHVITCPFEAQHTEPGGQGTFAANANEDYPWQIYCSHASCLSAGYKRADFIAEWIREGKLVAGDLGIEGWQLPEVGSFSVPVKSLNSAKAQFNERWAAVAVKSKTRYLRFNAEGECEFFDKTNFLNLHEACKVWDGNEPSPFAPAWLGWEGRRQFDGFGFYPGGNAPVGCFNLWRGFRVEPKAGDWSLLRRHIFNNICQHKEDYFDWLMDWLADLFQHPGSAHVVLIGEEGVGKSKLGEWIIKALGKCGMSIMARSHLVGNFNAHLETLLFAMVEEVFWAGDKQAEGVIKSLATSESISYERKGVDVYDGKNYTRIMITSNEPWVVPAWSGGRRWFVLEVGDAHQQDTTYFSAIDEQMENGGLAAMLHELLNRTIKSSLRNAPITPWLVEQRIASADPKRLWLRDLISEGGFQTGKWAGAGESWFELNMNEDTAILRRDLFESGKEAFSRPGRPASEKLMSDWLKKELKDLFNADGKRETITRKGKKERPRTWGFAPLKYLEKFWLEKYGEDLSIKKEEPTPMEACFHNGGD